MDVNILEKSEKELSQSELKRDENNLDTSIAISQNQFVNGILGQAVNKAVDIGIKSILPDYIEDIAIDIKDTLMNEGLKDGINSIVNKAVDVGKSALGIITGKFETVEQLNLAIKKGGIIDKTSNLIDDILKKIQDKDLIDKDTIKIIKEGKSNILKNIDRNIDDTMDIQINSIEKVSKYSENWNKYYLQNDLNGMEKEFKKIQKEMKEIIPLENMIKEVRNIENLHNLIKNNGGNFDLSKEQIELAKKLV